MEQALGMDPRPMADLVSTLAEQGKLQEFAAGELIFAEGERSDAVYLLLSGRVKVYSLGDRRREVIYNVLGPDSFFGEMCLDGGARSASVSALERSRCVVLSAADLREFMQQQPDFAVMLVHLLIGRIRQNTELLKSLALEDVYRRTVLVLQRMLVEENGRWFVEAPITQADIASRIGATREMVNRVFRQLSRAGYLGRDRRRRIEVLKPLPKDW